MPTNSKRYIARPKIPVLGFLVQFPPKDFYGKNMSMISHFILYVSDQAASTLFYEIALEKSPTLNVPGMTEFTLGSECILGLMPSKGIRKLLGNSIQDPEIAKGIPRAEIYLQVEEPQKFFERAISAGAKLLSPLELRDWGHEAGYLLDPDGHVIAFAKAMCAKGLI